MPATVRIIGAGLALLVWMAVAVGPGAPQLAVGPAEAAEGCPSGPQPVGSLSVGRGLFWDGEYVDTETGEASHV